MEPSGGGVESKAGREKIPDRKTLSRKKCGEKKRFARQQRPEGEKAEGNMQTVQKTRGDAQRKSSTH